MEIDFASMVEDIGDLKEVLPDKEHFRHMLELASAAPAWQSNRAIIARQEGVFLNTHNIHDGRLRVMVTDYAERYGSTLQDIARQVTAACRLHAILLGAVTNAYTAIQQGENTSPTRAQLAHAAMTYVLTMVGAGYTKQEAIDRIERACGK